MPWATKGRGPLETCNEYGLFQAWWSGNLKPSCLLQKPHHIDSSERAWGNHLPPVGHAKEIATMPDIFGYDTEKRWDYENGFYLTSDVTRMGKLLAHYELYKRIVDLPGHIVELGVFKGTSLVRLATFMQLMESPFSRKIIGFDAFGDFPKAAHPVDQAFATGWQEALGSGIPAPELEKCFQYKGFGSYTLIPGDINKTLPEYVDAHPEFKVAMLHIDTDVYEPAMTGLTTLWERIVPGGVLVLDDYGTEYGGTRAVDEFFSASNVRIRKLHISHTCPSYVIKE
jgi:hypothetical protein